VPRLLVIGSANLDFTVAVERLPREGETVSGGTLLVSHGGKGANQAWAAHRLGAEVRLVAQVGQDAMGDQIVEHLSAAGFPREGLLHDPSARTGVALIAVDREGRNQIAVAPGANRTLSPERLTPFEGWVAWADVILCQLESPIETVRWVLTAARRLGKRTLLNPAPPRPLPGDLYPLVDVLTPNEGEALALGEVAGEGRDAIQEAARRLVERGAGVVVVTLGADGALLVTREDALHVPGFSVEAVDTTAAGDAFTGALATALGSGSPLPDAIRFANAASALTCTRRGAQESLPERSEVEALLREKTRRPT
jgi:ribokinase